MKRSPIWEMLAAAPSLDVIAIDHAHSRDRRGDCSKVKILVRGACLQGLRIHLFHDDADRLYVVKLPGDGRAA